MYTQDQKIEMYESVKNLVWKLAMRHAGVLSIEELVAVGNLAVMKAMEKWDSSRTKFVTFCHHYIRGYMLDATNDYRKVKLALSESIIVEDKDCFSAITKNEWWEDILHPLDDRQRKVITLLFRDDLTLHEISKKLKISRITIMKIRDKALKVLWIKERDKRLYGEP